MQAGHTASREGTWSTTYLGIQPGAHYFVAQSFSLTLALALSYQEQKFERLSTRQQTLTAGVVVGVGYDLRLAEKLSWWYRGGLAYYLWNTSNDDASFLNGESGALMAMINMPLLFHPVPHFFLGLGPEVWLDLARTGDDDDPRFSVAVSSTLGGWL